MTPRVPDPPGATPRPFTRRQALRGGLALGASLALGGACAPDFQLRQVRAHPSRRAPVLVVFLTGFSDDREEVEQHGVIDTITEHAGPVDVLVVQRETPQFFSGELSAELDRRVADQPWFQQYPRRVLIGFSGGGTAALRYIIGRPEVFDDAVLYAPYLGPEFIVEEIEAAGGLARWQPSGAQEGQEALWVWLRRYGAGEVTRPSLHLLWSREDEVSVGLSLLEAHLPAHRLMIGEGKHGWEAFDPMWPQFVRQHRGIFGGR